jgi:hypothetical protein
VIEEEEEGGGVADGLDKWRIWGNNIKKNPKNLREEIPYSDHMVEFITLNTRINHEIVRLIQNRVQIISSVDRLINILSPKGADVIHQ